MQNSNYQPKKCSQVDQENCFSTQYEITANKQMAPQKIRKRRQISFDFQKQTAIINKISKYQVSSQITPKILDVTQTYYEMQRYKQDLKQYLQQNREVFNIKQRLDIAKSLVDKLQSLHKLGIIHLDIKPQNVVIKTVDGKIKLRIIDFDCSLQQGQLLKKSQGFSKPYSCPEIINMKINEKQVAKAEPSMDVYSLGFVLSQLFFGNKPVNYNRDKFMGVVFSAPAISCLLSGKPVLNNCQFYLGMRNLVGMCLREPKHRPSCSKIKQCLLILANTILQQ